MANIYIIMYSSPIGFQQVRETGTFVSRKQAGQFATHNEHLMLNDEGNRVDVSNLRIFELREAN